MAEEVKEVWSWKLDVSDVEAKAKRVADLYRKIQETEKAGGDSSGIRADLQKEAEFFGQLTKKQDEAGLSVDSLIHKKRALNETMRLMGIEIGGLTGGLHNAAELFPLLGKAAAPVIAIIAGITAAKAGWDAYNESVKKAIEHEERLAALQTARRERAQSEQATIDESLKAMGTLTPENESAAFGASTAIKRRFGLKSPKAAALAAAAGITDVNEVGMLGLMLEGGAEIKDADAAKAALEGVQSDAKVKAAFEAELRNRATTEEGKDVRAQAAIDQSSSPRKTPLQRMYDQLKANGRLPDGVTTEAGLEKYIAEAEEARTDYEKKREHAANSVGPGDINVNRATVAKTRLEKFGNIDQEYEQIKHVDDEVPESPATIEPGPGGRSASSIVVNNYTQTIHNGTVYSGNGNPFMDGHNDLASGGSPGSGQMSRH